MRIGAPGADEDGFDVRIVGQVVCEGEAHGRVLVALERKMVVHGGAGHEGIDGSEGMKWGDVDRREEGRELGMGGEAGEVEDEKHEAVFAAVVGEGKRRESVHEQTMSSDPDDWNYGVLVVIQGFLNDGERLPGLVLYRLQPFRLDVFLKERSDLTVELRAQFSKRGAVAIRGM